MGTIRVTRRELELGISVPLDERTRIVPIGTRGAPHEPHRLVLSWSSTSCSCRRASRQLPPGYARLPIADSTPHGRADADALVLLTSPNAPLHSRMRCAPQFSDLVCDGLNALYVDAQGGFVDVGWSKW